MGLHVIDHRDKDIYVTQVTGHNNMEHRDEGINATERKSLQGTGHVSKGHNDENIS